MTIKFRDRLSGLSFGSTPTSNDLTNIQRAADESFRYIANLPWNQGRLITGISVSGTAVDVAHGLGRAWQGWIIVDITTTRDVYRDTATTPDVTKFLRLRSSNPAHTVSIWVF
jgi:hypothetical protein